MLDQDYLKVEKWLSKPVIISFVITILLTLIMLLIIRNVVGAVMVSFSLGMLVSSWATHMDWKVVGRRILGKEEKS